MKTVFRCSKLCFAYGQKFFPLSTTDQLSKVNKLFAAKFYVGKIYINRYKIFGSYFRKKKKIKYLVFDRKNWSYSTFPYYHEFEHYLVKIGRTKLIVYLLQRSDKPIDNHAYEINTVYQRFFEYYCIEGNVQKMQLMNNSGKVDKNDFYLHFIPNIETLKFLMANNFTLGKFYHAVALLDRNFEMVKYIVSIDKNSFTSDWYAYVYNLSGSRTYPGATIIEDNQDIFEFLEGQKINYNKNGLLKYLREKNDEELLEVANYVEQL